MGLVLGWRLAVGGWRLPLVAGGWWRFVSVGCGGCAGAWWLGCWWLVRGLLDGLDFHRSTPLGS